MRSSNRALRASQRSLPLGLAPRGRAAHEKRARARKTPWHDAASAIFRPSSGSAKYVVWAGTARADRQRANVDKLVKGARAVLPDYSLPE